MVIDIVHTIFHNMLMNTVRITVSLPKPLAKELKQLTRSGSTSRFVSDAVREALIKKKSGGSALDEFLKVREKTKKLSHRDIMKAIEKGRK